MVAERYADKPLAWKLPGGYVQPGALALSCRFISFSFSFFLFSFVVSLLFGLQALFSSSSSVCPSGIRSFGVEIGFNLPTLQARIWGRRPGAKCWRKRAFRPSSSPWYERLPFELSLFGPSPVHFAFLCLLPYVIRSSASGTSIR